MHRPGCHSFFPVLGGVSRFEVVQELERSKGVARERAVLVSVLLPEAIEDGDPLEELRGLAKTAGAVIVAELTQRRDRPAVGTYLGSGKVEELDRLAKRYEADVILFDGNLSPGQVRNLERAIKLKVLDRTELILDIFASNARTYEARLAVELAQMEYSLPRLKQMWSHLSRIRMGIGMRGPGEKQLETDRRLVERRIHELREELRAIERRRERQVASRSEHMTVSLVGYTNAGKSTLMNALTDAGVLAEDKLFATLDTRTRRWQLPNWGPVLLSDTVGFIRDLPHGLIASFKATLAEARQADLLFHVADASNPRVFQQISSVFAVLEELQMQEKRTLLLLNKIDDPRAETQLDALLNRYPNAIPISARSGVGLEQLAHATSDALSTTFVDAEIEAHVGDGKLLAQLRAHGEVLSCRYVEDRVFIHCRIPQRHLARLVGPEAIVRGYGLAHAPGGSGSGDERERRDDSSRSTSLTAPDSDASENPGNGSSGQQSIAE